MNEVDKPVMIPCPDCGADVTEGESTKTTATRDFEFGGSKAEQEVPAFVCPDCGKVVPV
jgi:predicted RNA-binding Zn-ribbon protein involved in translation (DUF1610 family)